MPFEVIVTTFSKVLETKFVPIKLDLKGLHKVLKHLLQNQINTTLFSK